MKLLRQIRRDVANNEPTWVWGRRWDCGAGFTKGFGLGFHVRTDEFDVTLGPFSLGGVRNGR